MNTEVSVFGFKSKSTTRRCESNCVPGKSDGDLWGITLGTTEVLCCAQNECNTATGVMRLNIQLAIAIISLLYM